MSIKLKALGLGVIAAMAVSAVAVMNASATAGGTFHTTAGAHITGHVQKVGQGAHNFHHVSHGLSGEMGCANQTYTATVSASTTTSITVFPTYANCYTTPDTGNIIHVRINGCTYTFTVRPITTPEPVGGNQVEQTAHLLCPTGKKIEIEDTNAGCVVSVDPQTIDTGITYTTALSATNVHEITMDVNVQYSTTRHGGLCIFVPTNGTSTLKGSATITASVGGNQVNLTAD